MACEETESETNMTTSHDTHLQHVLLRKVGEIEPHSGGQSPLELPTHLNDKTTLQQLRLWDDKPLFKSASQINAHPEHQTAGPTGARPTLERNMRPRSTTVVCSFTDASNAPGCRRELQSDLLVLHIAGSRVI